MPNDVTRVNRRIAGMLVLGLGLWLLLFAVQAMCLPFDGYVTAHIRADGGTLGFGPLLNRLFLEAVDRIVSYPGLLFVYGGLLVCVALYSSASIAVVMTERDEVVESLRKPLVVVVAILAVCTIFNLTYLSNDLYLYRLYGHMLHLLHLNPYAAVPIEQFGSDEIVNVPWTDQNAAYGPVALFAFGLTSRLAHGIVAQFWLLKGVLALPWCAILVAIAVSRKFDRAAKVRMLAWIGLSPVLLFEVCQNSHLEGWIGLLLLGTVLVLSRRTLPRVAVAGVLFGLACGVKLSVGVVVPAIAMQLFLSRRVGRDSWKPGVVACAVFGLSAAITLAVSYGPSWIGLATFDGLRLESAKVLRSIFALLRDSLGLGPAWIRRLATLGLISSSVAGAWAYAKRRRLDEAIILSLGVQAYLGRTFFQPWYLAAMVIVAVAPRLLAARDDSFDRVRLSAIERILLVAGAFAVVGSYTGIIVTQSRSVAVLSISTLSILLLPLLALGVERASSLRRTRGS